MSLQSYWDKILSDSGLSMENGRSPRLWVQRNTLNEHRLDVLRYVGTSNDLVAVEEEQMKIKLGIRQLQGAGPD